MESSKGHILVVEDDVRLRGLVESHLRSYAFSVQGLGDGRQVERVLAESVIDLIVLDLGLPGDDGLQICRRLRQKCSVPILMLTARGDELDRILGLEMGADDYLAKPFSPRELVARIRAILRRIAENPGAGVLSFGPLTLDPRAHRAMVDGRDLTLTSAELRILELLIQADTRTVSREELMLQALGRRLLPTDRSLDTHVSNLRRKLARHTESVSIQGVRGAGYALGQR